jgi:hypothetical protein
VVFVWALAALNTTVARVAPSKAFFIHSSGGVHQGWYPGEHQS